MTDQKKIYVAGPYTNPDPVENTRNAILTANELRRLGFTPFVPHLTLMWHLVAPHPVDFWYDYDNEWLRVCDAVLRLPGESIGADNEVKLAKSLDIRVYTEFHTLVYSYLGPERGADYLSKPFGWK